MSLLAFFFLSLCIICALLGLSVELAEAWATLAKAGAVLFGSLFTGSLIVGKRIKFDPVLR